jgi:transposase
LVAFEVGAHSPWLSRTLEESGIDFLVANTRKLQLISRSDSKNDRADAELLARLAAADPALLSPVRHRGKRAQAGLALLKTRDALVRSRTAKVLQIRGLAKSFGVRLPKCATSCFSSRSRALIPEDLRPAVDPLLDAIETETALVKACDKQIRHLCDEEFPETRFLLQVHGVGEITALAYVLTIEDPHRFRRSRQVGAYLGMRPRQHESGAIRKQMHITKAGDRFLRTLLVQCAHYILGPFGQESDLREWGLALAERGGTAAKRRAIVATARKLAVLLHRLWVSQATYQPLREEVSMTA